MAIISKKKIPFKVNPPLHAYLVNHNRAEKLPLSYNDLLRYDNSIPLYDKRGTDTLWETVFYPQGEMEVIHKGLKQIYAFLKAAGDMTLMEHLFIDRVDLCVYGNTRPFRVRIVNQINDLFDYFYIKKADASRIYGLELEHLLSPNKINFLVDDDTLIEEHIQGIAGDQFMEQHLKNPEISPIRLAKEFVKFNERCLVRLLGDMHSSNFVVEIIPDFDETHFRLRAIDFDQQSYEGRRVIYMPQYFKQNNRIIELGIKHINVQTSLQYEKEERFAIITRLNSARYSIKELLDAMIKDTISSPGNEYNLKYELAALYKDDEFLKCRNMGEILKTSLKMLFKKPIRPR